MKIYNDGFIEKATIVWILCMFIFTCSKKDEQEKYDLRFSGKEYYGCFKTYIETFKNGFEDSVYLKVRGDTLILDINKAYNCCGKLADEMDIVGDNINIYIQDTCSGNKGSCRCICSFGFEYKFTGFKNKNTAFYIYLKELNQTEYTLWKKTKYIDGLD